MFQKLLSEEKGTIPAAVQVDIALHHGPFGVWGTVFSCDDGIVAVNRGKIAVWQGTGISLKRDAYRNGWDVKA